MPFRKWMPLELAEVPLGAFSDDTRPLSEDDAEVAEWLRGAAERGSAEARFNLALMYAKGEGVARDYVAAHMWADLAAAGAAVDVGEGAARLRDEIAGHMTADEVAEARRRAHARGPRT